VKLQGSKPPLHHAGTLVLLVHLFPHSVPQHELDCDLVSVTVCQPEIEQHLIRLVVKLMPLPKQFNTNTDELVDYYMTLSQLH